MECYYEKGEIVRVCLIGNMEGNIDEGMKKVTFNTYTNIKQNNETLSLNPYNVTTIKFWKEYVNFQPEIIHYLTGPSLSSFFLVKLLSMLSKDSKTIITASHPKVKCKSLLKFLKTDCIIIHSEEYEKSFKSLNFNTKFIPNGVDLSKFKKIDDKQKNELRIKYSIPNEKFIILHVGNILKERNIDILKKLQNENNQVLIVGSTSIEVDGDVLKELENHGCIVITHYIENIHEIYQSSDCYIFPTVEKIRAIEIPLSVLEAMACNLPVISTRFGGLPILFEEGNGLFFINSFDEVNTILNEIKSKNVLINTENLVKILSWENIGNELNKLYQEIRGEA